jgi:hypothetical protein
LQALNHAGITPPRAALGGGVSEDAALAFARESLRSIWSLELLTVLKAHPKKQWAFEELERELRATPQIVGEAVQTLVRLGVAAGGSADVCYYAPRDAAIDAVVEELLRLYAVKPTSVMKAIYASPTDRIQTFAEAFKIKD